MILAENQTFDDGAYRIESFIARGGMAEVWRAEKVSEKKSCAIKILTRKSLSHDDVVERFKLEYQMLQKLNHPNIVSVYDFGWYNARDVKLPWYSMEYFPFNLRQRLPQVSIGEGIRLMLPVLDALDFAHSKKICHRDLKPINILVDSEGRAALTDFGIAKEMDKNRNLTGRNIIGTATYISPEQCLGVQVVPASDIYSMGVILYQLCTGRFPFEDPSEITVIQKHIKETPADVRTVNAAISDELAECVMKCLEKKPENRFQAARDLRIELMRCPELQESVERILKPGELIVENKYRVVTLIEQGGFAEVYRVKDLKTGRPYALKILMPALTYDAETLKRFEREIKILKSLDHPHIVKAVDSGHYPYKTLSLPFFVMRYYAGNLQAAMNEPINKDKAIEVIIEILEALSHSHGMEGGIFHRDLKPSNILISSDGHGFLTDFGIAKVSKSLTSIVTRSATMTRAAMGTSIYMAPEQIRNDAVTGQTDLYSIGVILYEIAAGKRPFDAKSSEQITAMHLYVEPESPRIHNPKILPKLEAVILRCLEKDPAKRYANVGDLIEALTQARSKGSWFGDAQTTTFSRKEITKSLVKSFRSPAPYLAAAAAAAMFVLGAGGAMAYRQMQVPLPQGASKMSIGYYPIKAVSAVKERGGTMAKALGQAGTLSVAQVPQGPPITVPPEFLKPEDQPLFEAMKKARQDAASSQDVALARRLDARMTSLLADAEKPSVRVSESTAKSKSTNRDREDFTVAFASSAMRDDLREKFKYDPKLFAVQKDGQRRPVQNAAAEFTWDKSTGQAQMKIAGLAPGSYVTELVTRFDSSTPGVNFQQTIEHNFDITFQNVPVNVAVAEKGKRWKLTQNTDPKNQLISWDWTLKDLKSGQLIPAPATSKNTELTIDDDAYAKLPQGRYAVICEASTRENLKASSDESANVLVVDWEPPTVEIAGGQNQIMILPSDGRVSVSLAVKDNLQDPSSLIIREDRGGALTGGVRNVDWAPPAGRDSFGKATLTFIAEDPEAREKWRRSAPISITVTSVSKPTEDLLSSWRDQETQITAGTARYARTNALAPVSADIAPAIQANAINRTWLEAAITQPARIESLRTLLTKRKDLKEKDDQFQARADAFLAVVANAPAAHKSEVEGAVRQMATSWLTASADVSPKDFLKPVEAKLLPPVPVDAIQRVPNPQNPEQSEIRVASEYASQFGASTRYRYLFTPQEPKTKDVDSLGKMLSAQAVVNANPRYRPVGEDLAKPLYLVIQTVLDGSTADDSFVSPPTIHAIEPLIKLDDQQLKQLDSYAELLANIRKEGRGTYQRTVAFIEKQNFPFIKADTQRADVMWLIRNSEKPEEMKKIQDAAAQLEKYQQGDRAFETASAEQIKGKTEAWTPEHRQAVTDQVKKGWASQSAETDPTGFTVAQIDAYLKTAAPKGPVLAGPKVEGRFNLMDDGKKLETALQTVKNLERVFVAWGATDKDLDAAANWPVKDASGKIDLREPPDRKKTYALAMRYQVDQDGVPVKSGWTRIGNFTPLTPTPTATPVSTPKPTQTPEAPRPTPAAATPTPAPSTPAPTPARTEAPPAPASGLTLAEVRSWAATAIAPTLPTSGGLRTPEPAEKWAPYLQLFSPGAKDSSSLVAYFKGEGNRLWQVIMRGQNRFVGVRVEDADPAQQKFRLIFDLENQSNRNRSSYNAIITLKKADGRITIEKEEGFKPGAN